MVEAESIDRDIVYEYDNLSRQETEIGYNDVTDADADQNRQNEFAYSYDAAGRMLSISKHQFRARQSCFCPKRQY